uniref:B30.2/SPRY domain-containing protein n=1 Tax=Sphaeramia orbicularis TaxID=375764 RepID=A0A672YWK4_9TELE
SCCLEEVKKHVVLLCASDACDLTLDPNTVNQSLALSDDNRTVTETKEKLPYPNHPERFNHWKQVLCKEGLTGRCYWEVECKGWVNIGVAYKGIKRKGQDDDCWIGQNDKSWSLMCCDDKFTACHKNTRTVLRTPPALDCGRVGVYLDCLAGTLSFYRVSSDTLIHLHTFHTTFTEPLYAAFGFEFINFSVTLCQI